jgi:hypothetical protein
MDCLCRLFYYTRLGRGMTGKEGENYPYPKYRAKRTLIWLTDAGSPKCEYRGAPCPTIIGKLQSEAHIVVE